MSSMATLNIRNVPEGVVKTLKRRAKQNGRSLNAEVVEILKNSGERYTEADLLRELDELHAEWVLPEGAPSPEDVIREAREERTREIDRRVRGL